jgi:hypothetical protein
VVSESFPVEVRALCIALFFALGTAIGGIGAPWLFGVLIGSGESVAIAWGYALGALMMMTAAAVTLCGWAWRPSASRSSKVCASALERGCSRVVGLPLHHRCLTALQGGEQQRRCNRRREGLFIEEDGELAMHALQQILDGSAGVGST